MAQALVTCTSALEGMQPGVQGLGSVSGLFLLATPNATVSSLVAFFFFFFFFSFRSGILGIIPFTAHTKS